MKGKLSQPSEWDRSEPFCVMDLGYVYNEYQRWTSLLPDVKPFYGWSLLANSLSLSLSIMLGFRLTMRLSCQVQSGYSYYQSSECNE